VNEGFDVGGGGGGEDGGGESGNAWSIATPTSHRRRDSWVTVESGENPRADLISRRICDSLRRRIVSMRAARRLREDLIRSWVQRGDGEEEGLGIGGSVSVPLLRLGRRWVGEWVSVLSVLLRSWGEEHVVGEIKIEW